MLTRVSNAMLEDVNLTRVAIKALNPTAKATAYLSESGREGQFTWRDGDYSAQISADPMEGVYLKANEVAATSGAWVRVFSGPASVEWWGAKADDTSDITANTLAIQAAIDAYGSILLGFGTYHTNDTLRIRKSLKTLQGMNYNNTTKITIHSATKDCLFVGPGTYTPGDTSTFIYDIRLSDFSMYRAVAAVTPLTADKDGACGLRQAGVIRCLTDHVFTYDDYIGFYIVDTTNADFSNCSAITGRTSGTYFGWYVDGVTTSDESRMSSNASARYADCLVLAANVDTSVGWEIIGRFSDQFLLRPETALVNYGIRIRGMTDYGGADSRQNIDVQIVDPIMDGIKSCGLFVRGTDPYGAISVVGGYGAVYGGVTASIITLDDAQGTIISGFQFIGFPSTLSQGLVVSGGKGNIAANCIWQDCNSPIVLNNTNLNRVSGEVTNISQAPGKIGASLTSAARNKIDVSVFGNATGKFATGINLDAASGSNEINCTGIDPGTVTAKVKIGGTAVTTAGLAANGNLITGVMT